MKEEFVSVNPETFAPVPDSSVHTLFFVKLKFIYRMLKRHDWNRTKAAYELDISYRTITNYVQLMKRVGWHVPSSIHHPFVKSQKTPMESQSK